MQTLNKIQERCYKENKDLKIVNETPVMTDKEPEKTTREIIMKDLDIDNWREGRWNDNSVYDPTLGIDIIPA